MGEINEAEVAVVEEAGAATTVYRLSSGSEAEALATRAALGNYLRLAISRDWPQMAVEKGSADVTRALDALYESALRLAQSGSRQPAVLLELFNQLDTITKVC